MKYLRKKGRWKTGETKYVIEENNRYVRTVPTANELDGLLQLDGKAPQPSQDKPNTRVKGDQEFGQERLYEPSKEDIHRTLAEISK